LILARFGKENLVNFWSTNKKVAGSDVDQS